MNNTQKDIIDILDNVPKDKCWFGGKVGEAKCRNCKFWENNKCTFNIWEWKGIGS